MTRSLWIRRLISWLGLPLILLGGRMACSRSWISTGASDRESRGRGTEGQI